jgi:dihydroxyacetone kinase-like protein
METTTSLTKEQVIKWLNMTANVMEENKELLTQLDAAIGDAEHGISMARGFREVANRLPDNKEKDIGSILKTTGMTLVSTMGGAGGSLFGTFFMEGSKEITGKQELNTTDVVAFFSMGLQGVIKRGGAQPGDKTMVDSLAPAVTSFDHSLQNNLSTVEAIGQATVAAQEGMIATAQMIAKKGRASYLGERSIGHQDAGATSLYLIIKALYDTVSYE